VRCSLLGTYQPSNALVAAVTARSLGLPEAAIRAGLGRVSWPGRFHVVERDPVLVLDGAHNPGAARALAASLAAYFPAQPLTLVLGVSADDQAGILRASFPASSHPTAYAGPRAASRWRSGRCSRPLMHGSRRRACP
jgi:folylpolyglutamate synthase/dihydropteroate synthase